MGFNNGDNISIFFFYFIPWDTWKKLIEQNSVGDCDNVRSSTQTATVEHLLYLSHPHTAQGLFQSNQYSATFYPKLQRWKMNYNSNKYSNNNNLVRYHTAIILFHWESWKCVIQLSVGPISSLQSVIYTEHSLVFAIIQAIDKIFV